MEWRQADRRDLWLSVFLDAAHKAAMLGPWEMVSSGEDGGLYIRRQRQQSVIISGGYRGDEQWVHVSTAMPSRLPTWEEFSEVKRVFMGPDLTAIQVFPPQAEYVNVHPNCLHLYARMDQRVVPDLRIGGTI